MEAWTCTPCKQNAGVTNVTFLYNATLEAQGYVAVYKGTPIVVFRGTTTLENWIYDFDFTQVAPVRNCAGTSVR